jgi:hypothetical protein
MSFAELSLCRGDEGFRLRRDDSLQRFGSTKVVDNLANSYEVS